MTLNALNATEPAGNLPDGLPEALEKAMRQRGFSELTAVQTAVLAADPDGQDLRISSQTGSGKTVAIGLALARHLLAAANERKAPSVLLLTPTRELAMQVRDELHWLYAGVPGLRIEVVMGGASIGTERRALGRNPQVVVGTPGRVLDHIRTRALSCERVAHVVLDEADRMLDMGFRDDLEAILEGMPSERRTHLISATFPHAVRKLADRFQTTPQALEGTRLGDANVDIQHAAHLVRKHQRYGVLVNVLLMNEGARCLVFVERRVDASSLADKLSSDGFAASSLSGDLPQAQRTRTINAFRNGTTRILVSTDVAARGIDVPDIEVVAHFDLPDNADTYVHRSGRTGRAGRQGRSLVLVPPQAKRSVERMLVSARIEVQWQPVPSAAKVRKTLRKRFRKTIHANLESGESTDETQVEYAKLLLEGRDPATVVASLMEMAQRPPVTEPVDVSDPAPGDYDDRRSSPRRAGGRRDTAATRPRPRRPQTDAVRFSINWGTRNGAATNRLLSHVCRRGQIQGNLVGAIEIGPESSTFDVDSTIASRFELHARTKDPREPQLRIERVHSAAHSRTRTASPQGKSKPTPKRSSYPKSTKPYFGASRRDPSSNT